MGSARREDLLTCFPPPEAGENTDKTLRLGHSQQFGTFIIPIFQTGIINTARTVKTLSGPCFGDGWITQREENTPVYLANV